MLDYEPMSPNLPRLESIIRKVPIIEISSSNSPNPTSKSHSALDSFELDPSEVTSITVNRVSGHGRASRPYWIITLIILHGHGCYGCSH